MAIVYRKPQIYKERAQIDSNTSIYWKMDSVISTIYNEINAGLPSLSTEIGNPAYGVNGLFEKCISMSNSVLSTIPTSLSSSKLTISAWVKINTHVSNATIISKNYLVDDWSSPYSGIKIAIEATQVYVYAYINGSPVTLYATSSIPINKWLLISVTHDQSNLKCYVNGVLLGTSAAIGTISYGNGRWAIGGISSTVTGNRIDGLINDVRIELVARSANYLLNMYNLARL